MFKAYISYFTEAQVGDIIYVFIVEDRQAAMRRIMMSWQRRCLG